MEIGVLPPRPAEGKGLGSVGQRSRLWRLQSRGWMLVVCGERLGAQELQGRSWYHFAEGLGCCELQLLRKGYGGIVEQGWGSWRAVRLGAGFVPGARAGLAWAPRGFLPGPLKNRWLV